MSWFDSTPAPKALQGRRGGQNSKGEQMTLPDERTRAVIAAQDFLRRLLDPKETPRVPKSIRKEARSILRHYPSEFYIEIAAQKAPNVFKSTDR